MVLLTIDFWSNRQMNSYIGLGLTVHLISNSKLHNAMLAFLADDRKPQLEEIVSNFEIVNKLIFSVAGQMFKPDRCRLTDKIFEALIFINNNKDFTHWLFLFNYYFNVFVAVA